ncbi:unnamed protein product [Lactuca virosa]|uniref:Poly [ADP-ribose] polymerase n=1 Tax=Lactuca virosa TaxID=75947 RepID=A0AAU9N2H0_9ASTR|nr:unnamed protein product [Lactuca virosa]
MLLSEVALGEMYELKKAKYMEKPPKGKDPTKGLGKKIPNESEHFKWKDDVVVPCGKSVSSNVKTYELMYNEYIVYNTDQKKLHFDLYKIEATEESKSMVTEKSQRTNLSDLSTGINSYYILQIYEEDKGSGCYVFQKWGRVSNEKIGGNKLEELMVQVTQLSDSGTSNDTKHIQTIRERVLETILCLRFFIFQYGIVYKLHLTGNNTSLLVLRIIGAVVH